MKSTMKFQRRLNKLNFELPFILKDVLQFLLSLLLIAITVTSCKSDVETSTNFVYGISTPQTSYVNVPDSIVQINMSDGTYKNLFSIDKFEGVKSIQEKVYSKNLNILAYQFEGFKIGFINLNNLTSDVINFQSDSTLYGIRSLLIVEKRNVLIAVNIYYNHPGSSRTLELVEIDLKTKAITNRIKLNNSIDLYNIFSEIDEKNNRIFIIPDNYSSKTEKLYIYNYESKKLTNQTFKTRFIDVHYSSTDQCLIGTSFTYNNEFGLVSYSINNQKSDTIGVYTGIHTICTKMNFIDNQNHLYWLGVFLPDRKSTDIPLVNIKLSDASFSKTIVMHKIIDVFK